MHTTDKSNGFLIGGILFALSASYPSGAILGVLYNYSSTGCLSWALIGQEIFPLAGFPNSGLTPHLLIAIFSYLAAISLFVTNWVPKKKFVVVSTILAGFLVFLDLPSIAGFVQHIVGVSGINAKIWVIIWQQINVLIMLLIHITLFFWLLVVLANRYLLSSLVRMNDS